MALKLVPAVEQVLLGNPFRDVALGAGPPGCPVGEPVLLPAPPSADWHLYSQSLEMDGAVYFLWFPFSYGIR